MAEETPPKINLQIPGFQALSTRLRELLDRIQPSEETILVATSLIVGLGTGVGAVAFRYLIRGVGWLGFNWVPSITEPFGKTYVLIIPTIGGLIVGLLVFYFAKEAKGHGVPEVMEAVALKGGRIRPIVAVIKSLASSINIGTGGSVGREGPIVQIGAALGSSIGQALHLSDERIRNLVACGAAGGIAATFNAPIAGVIFALEIILGEFSVKYFSTVVISAISASIIGQAVFGDVPAFPLPMEYQIKSPWEFALYPLLGILAALIGVLFVKLLYWTEDQFERWKSVPEWFQPAVGGALLGAVGLAYPLFTGISWDRMPQIFSIGYDVIELALLNKIALGAVLVLLVLKLIATCLTLGSGGSGGIFSPALFMGAMLGTAFGLGANALFPGITAPPGAYALVGMAAVFAAAAHAPITAVLILFELTGDYRIIMPLMLAVVIATLIAQAMLNGESIYTLKLTRRGIRLQRGQDIDVMHGVKVGEVMSQQVDVVTTSTTLDELSDEAVKTNHHGFPVLDEEGKLWGVVTISDLEAALAANMPHETPVSKIGVSGDQLLVCYPDETMGDALERMGTRGLGRLPVVSRDDPRHLVGLIRRSDIIRAYRLALTRRADIQNRVQRLRLQNIDGTQFVELKLSEQDVAVGKKVKELAQQLPEDCLLISIRRDGRVFIPHGDTVFQAGDQITAFIRADAAETVFSCLRGSAAREPAET